MLKDDLADVSLSILKRTLKFCVMESAMIRAVASSRRCAILKLIWDRELSAGEIAARFTISWPAISQNLGVLRRAGAVTERRVGTRRLYRADRQALSPLEEVVRTMWAADLETLRALVEGDPEKPHP